VEVTVKVREKPAENFNSANFVIAVARRLRVDPGQLTLLSVNVDTQDQHGFDTGPAPRGESNRRFRFPDPKWDKPRFSSTIGYLTRQSPFSHELRRWVVVLQLSRKQAYSLRKACVDAGDAIHTGAPGIVECTIAGEESMSPVSPGSEQKPGSPSVGVRFEDPTSRSIAPSAVQSFRFDDFPLSGYYEFTRAEIKLKKWGENPQTKCVAAEAKCQWKTYFLFPKLNADTSAPWAMSSELQQARRLREFRPAIKEKLFNEWGTPLPIGSWEPWSGVQSPRRDGGPLYRPPTPPLVRHEPLWLDSGNPREDERVMQLSIHASWHCTRKKPREGCGHWNPLKSGKCNSCSKPRPKDVTEYAKARFEWEEHGGPGGGRTPWQDPLIGSMVTEERFGPVADGTVSTVVIGVAELTAKFPTPAEWNLTETVMRLSGRKLASTCVETRDRLAEKEERRRARIEEQFHASGEPAVAAQEEWDRLSARLKAVQADRERLASVEQAQRRQVELSEEACGVALGRILRLMDMETAWRLGLWLHWEEFTPREWLSWLGGTLMDQEESEKRPRIRQEEEEAWQKMHAGDTGAEKKTYKRLVPEPAAGKKCCIVPPTNPEMGPQPGVISEITPASVRVEFVDKRNLGRQDIKFEWYEAEQKAYQDEEKAREQAGAGDDDLDEDAKLAKRDGQRAYRIKRERILMLAYEILPMVPHWKGWSFVGLQDQEGNIIDDRAVQRFGVEEVAVRALRHGLVKDTKREKQSVKVFPTHGKYLLEDKTVERRFQQIEEAVRTHARRLNNWKELGGPDEDDDGELNVLPLTESPRKKRTRTEAGSPKSSRRAPRSQRSLRRN